MFSHDDVFTEGMLRRAFYHLLIATVTLFALWRCVLFYERSAVEEMVEEIEPVQQTLLDLTVAMVDLRGRSFIFDGPMAALQDQQTLAELIQTRDLQIANLHQLMTDFGLLEQWQQWLADFQQTQRSQLPPLEQFFEQSALVEQLALISEQVFYEWSARGKPSDSVMIGYEMSGGEFLRLSSNIGEVRALASTAGMQVPMNVNKKQALANIERIEIMLSALARRGINTGRIGDDLKTVSTRIRASRAALPVDDGSAMRPEQVQTAYAYWSTLVADTAAVTEFAQRLAGQIRKAAFAEAVDEFVVSLLLSLMALALIVLIYQHLAKADVERERISHYLSLAVSATHMGFSVRNLASGETYWSDEMRTILGVSEDVPPRPLPECAHPDDRKQLQEQLDTLIQAPMQAAERVISESRVLRPDGSAVWIHYVFSKVNIAPGQQGIVAVLLDVDEQTKTRQALERASETLEVRNEELQNFTRATAHDLLEPLRMMRSFAELLQAELTEHKHMTPDAENYLSYLTDGSARAQEALQALQRYLSIANPLPAVRVPLNDAVTGALADLDLAIQERNAVVEVGSLPQVMGSPQTLNSLFQNLIANALKYCPPERDPRVTICEQVVASQRLVTVADNGIGIPDVYLETIFEPFKRLHTRSEFSGTGLGLSICRRAMASMNGRIWASSEPGVGTVFYLDFGLELEERHDENFDSARSASSTETKVAR